MEGSPHSRSRGCRDASLLPRPSGVLVVRLARLRKPWTRGLLSRRSELGSRVWERRLPRWARRFGAFWFLSRGSSHFIQAVWLRVCPYERFLTFFLWLRCCGSFSNLIFCPLRPNGGLEPPVQVAITSSDPISTTPRQQFW